MIQFSSIILSFLNFKDVFGKYSKYQRQEVSCNSIYLGKYKKVILFIDQLLNAKFFYYFELN